MQNDFQDSMAGEGRVSPWELESDLRTISGSHVLGRINVQSTSISKLRRLLSAHTVYVDSLAFGCLVDLNWFHDFLDACKSGGGKW